MKKSISIIIITAFLVSSVFVDLSWAEENGLRVLRLLEVKKGTTERSKALQTALAVPAYTTATPPTTPTNPAQVGLRARSSPTKFGIKKITEKTLDGIALEIDLDRSIYTFLQSGREIEVKVETDFDETLPFVGQETAIDLKSLLQNLLANAIDAMKDTDSPLLRITFRLIGERGHLIPESIIEFVVADNGSGIDSDVLQKIFDTRFTTKDSQHTGLGLRGIRKIIKRFKGTIAVSSLTEEEYEKIKLEGYGYQTDLARALETNPALRKDVKEAYDEMIEASAGLEGIFEEILNEDITLEMVQRLLDEYVERVLSHRRELVRKYRATANTKPLAAFLQDSFTKAFIVVGITLHMAKSEDADAVKEFLEERTPLLRKLVTNYSERFLENFRRLAHGERIDRGTKFTVTFPIAKTSAVVAEQPLNNAISKIGQGLETYEDSLCYL